MKQLCIFYLLWFQKVARAILQPSQIPNTVDSKKKSTKVTHKLDGEKIDCANAPVENSLEENLRRDTYLVTNNGRYKPVCKTSPNTCTPKLTKPATKPVNGKKKRVVVAKKISPVSGNFGLFLYYILRKVTHIIICFLFFFFFFYGERVENQAYDFFYKLCGFIRSIK